MYIPETNLKSLCDNAYKTLLCSITAYNRLTYILKLDTEAKKLVFILDAENTKTQDQKFVIFNKTNEHKFQK